MPERVREKIRDTHDVNFVVIAGAGTGKTTLLISKIMSLLSQGHATMPELASITFTEKAASEIAARLKDELDIKLAQGEDPSGRLLKAREQLGSAAITTLHGFAARLLRERPVEAGLPPDHHVQDPVQAELLFDELFNRWEEEQLSIERPEWHRLLEHGLTNDLRTLARQLSNNLDTVLDHALSPPLPAEALGQAYQMAVQIPLERIRGAFSACDQPDDPGAIQAARQLELIRSLTPEVLAEPLELMRIVSRMPLNKRAGRKGSWRTPGALDEIRQATLELSDARTELETAWKDLLAYEAYSVLLGFLQRLQAEKLARGLVDFQDLLRMARDLLRNRKDVRAYFQEKFKVLLVDEFQDTDPLQAEILFYLAEDGARADNWRDARLIPGKLFIVGDPKQSIYRFRRADVEVFEEVSRLIEDQGGQKMTLERNFRSLSGIVHFINAYFGEQIREPENGEHYQPAYDVLKPERASSPGEARVEVLISEKVAFDKGAGEAKKAGEGAKKAGEGVKKAGEKGYSAGEARAIEASLVAERLRQMIDREPLVATKAGRMVQPGDVAILFRAVTHLDIYTDALRDRDIPYRVIGSKRFYAASEIVDLTNLLRAIAAPQDTLALVGALRSPAFGLNDLEITALSQARALDYRRDPRLSGVTARIDREALDARIRPIFKTLRRLHALRDRLSLSALVGEALTASSLWSVAYASFGGEQKALNLEKVRGLARSYEAAGLRSLMAFTDLLIDAIQGEQAEEESSATEEGDPVVRILTIHKSKGLEWPVVVLPGLMSSRDTSAPTFLEDRETGTYGFGLKDARTASYDLLKSREEPRLDAEAVRLFYVAATRARDYLILTGVHHQREDDSTLQRIETFFEGRVGERWRASAELQIEGSADDTELRALECARIRLGDSTGLLKIAADISVTRRSLIDAVDQVSSPGATARRGWIEASMQEAGAARRRLVAAAPAMTWVLPSKLAELVLETSGNGEAGDPGQAPPAALLPAEERAQLLGTLTHRAIELIDLGRASAPDPAEVVDRAARLLAWEGQPATAGVKEEARRLLERMLKGTLIGRLRKAKLLGHEVPLFYKPRPGLAIDGRIDLLFHDADGGLVVLDFKTDEVERGDEEAHARAYLPQLEVYVLAVKETTGTTPARMMLHYLRTDHSVEYEVDAMLLDRARERLELLRV